MRDSNENLVPEEGDSNSPATEASDYTQLSDQNFRVNEFEETVSFYPSVEQPASPPEPAPAIQTPAQPGVIGRYEILGLLGQGGFGAVYLGFDLQLQRRVAIKVPLLAPAKAAPKENVEADFLREARQLAQLKHANIVTVFDVGVDQGICYIVSDYIEGTNLNHWRKDRKVSWQEAVKIIADLADALAEAHAQGIVHRDVKPNNILMASRGEAVVPVLVDFGLAASETYSPRRGEISGTINYMSPEQARGRGHHIDGRTDIYSLGVIFYLLLSGRLPFKSPTFTELRQSIIEDEPPSPRQFVPNIPLELEQICLKSMAKQIADRFTTAGDLANHLRAFLKRLEPTEVALQSKAENEPPRRRESMKILIADDHELTRFKLQTDLEKWGHEVVAAEDGENAWELFQKGKFSIVITDWMMPRVDGLELVRRIRASNQSSYVYIIMLTAKSEKHDIVSGMGAGADDFLSKPVHRDELQVRLRAGIRITRLNLELNEFNQHLKYIAEAAGQIQRSFLPVAKPKLPGFDFAWEYFPCSNLGGDMLNIVCLDDRHAGVYVLDVDGSGVPAALLATTLARMFSCGSDAASVLVERSEDRSKFRILEPVEVAGLLNQRFARNQEARQFFTLAYGVLKLDTREFRYTNTGQTPILHQRAHQSPVMLDGTGSPIGLDPHCQDFMQSSLVLEPGDRLFLYTDGLPDTMNPDGEVFGAARLLDLVTHLYQQSLDVTVRSIMNELGKWRGAAESKDDISILAIEVK